MAQGARVPPVVHIISGLSTGGAEMMLLKLVSATSGLRHVVISLRDEGEMGDRLRAAGAEIHAMNIHRPAGIAAAPIRLPSLIGSQRPRVVQGWMNHGNVAASLFTPPKIPILWNVRQSLIDFDHEKRTTAALIKASPYFSRRPRTIIYNSLAGAEQHEGIGYPRAKRHIIPNGFDMRQFGVAPSVRRGVREQLGVRDDEILVGLVARFHPMKNQAGAIASLRLALPQNPRLRLVLVGSGTEASNPDMASLLTDPLVAKHCLALGLRHDVPELTGALDIAINTSMGEGFSNTIGEAMASGVPSIVTDVGDSAAIIGNTGDVVPRGRPDAMAQAILKWAAFEPAHRQAMGAQARERVRTHFSIEAVAQMYEKAYLDLA